MQLTAATFVVEKFALSTSRTTQRKFLEELIRADDNLNMDEAMIYSYDLNFRQYFQKTYIFSPRPFKTTVKVRSSQVNVIYGCSF